MKKETEINDPGSFDLFGYCEIFKPQENED